MPSTPLAVHTITSRLCMPRFFNDSTTSFEDASVERRGSVENSPRSPPALKELREYEMLRDGSPDFTVFIQSAPANSDHAGSFDGLLARLARTAYATNLRGSIYTLSYRSIARPTVRHTSRMCGLRKFGRLYRSDASVCVFPPYKTSSCPLHEIRTKPGAFDTPAWSNPGNRMTESRTHVLVNP